MQNTKKASASRDGGASSPEWIAGVKVWCISLICPEAPHKATLVAPAISIEDGWRALSHEEDWFDPLDRSYNHVVTPETSLPGDYSKSEALAEFALRKLAHA